MNIPEVLKESRRVLDGIHELSLINDWNWEPILKKWYFKFSITINESINIDSVTHWVLTVGPDYPNGSIDVFPDEQKGICQTYPHQLNNGIKSSNGIWKKGKICLDTPDFFKKSKVEYDAYLLEWFILRTVKWIEKANNSKLLENGDWFELPDYNVIKPMTIVYDEDEVSSMMWESHDERYGFVDLKVINNQSVYAITRYRDLKEHVLYEPVWGEYIDEKNSKTKFDLGAWILLKQVLVLNNWQAPNTYEELKFSLQNQGINLKDILSEFFPKFRDGKRHLLFFGFPVPRKIGESASSIVWKALLLPSLSYGSKYAKGFRNNELGWAKRDFNEILVNIALLEWVNTDNWNADNRLSRGKYTSIITSKKYLVIGAGTLSSFVCEQLVRNGVEDITIIDDDEFHAGNLARHLLTISDVSKNKGAALAYHLNSTNTHARINAITNELKSDDIAIFERMDVILDCTGNDKVLKIISDTQFRAKTIFFTISFGFNANIIYIAAGQAKTFSYEMFSEIFGDAIRNDLEKYKIEDIPWDGIGCWSPVFPAKTSDVMLAAATAVAIITHYLEKGEITNKNFIYQKKYDEDGFLIGYKEFIR